MLEFLRAKWAFLLLLLNGLGKRKKNHHQGHSDLGPRRKKISLQDKALLLNGKTDSFTLASFSVMQSPSYGIYFNGK
jgi:hypothetical protein